MFIYMSEKKNQALIKRDTQENWLKATNYIPMQGVIIVVDMPDGSVQLKLGDGQTLVNNLPNILENYSDNSKAPNYKDEVLEF